MSNNNTIITTTVSPIILVESPLEITGEIGLESNILVEMIETPSVIIDESVSVTGLIHLPPGVNIEIASLPTVSIEEPISVTGTLGLANGAELQVYGTPTVMTARGGTSILVGADSGLAVLAGEILGPINVAEFSSYKYVIYVSVVSALGVASYTFQPQVAAINRTSALVDDGASKNVSVTFSTTSQTFTLENTNKLPYSSLLISGGATFATLSYTVYLCGTY